MYTIEQHTAEGKLINSSHSTLSQQELTSTLHHQISIARRSPTFIRIRHKQFRESKLVALDLDGTLTNAEYMKVLANHTNNTQALKSLTASAVEGKTNWEQNFTKRVELLSGLSVKVADEVAKQIPLAPGAIDLIQSLKRKGISIIIITGAYQGLADIVAKQLDIDEVYSSHFEIIDNHFTGKILTPFLTPDAKADMLAQVITEKSLSIHECTAIGDSYNDLPMLASTGQAILYHAIQESPLSLNSLLPFI